MPKEVKALIEKFDTLKKKTKVSWTLLEDKCRNIVQGEDDLQDVELDMWKVNFDIIFITKELAQLEQELQVVYWQLG